MDEQRPITGHYALGRYVIVHGKTPRNELRLLGCFGSDLENVKRKEDNRQGLLDRQLLAMNPDVSDATVLTLHEAFFLTYALGCLDILSGESSIMSLNSCWSAFRNYHLKSNEIEFAIEYAVYHFLRSRGWIVKMGDNYGTNFLLYKEGPSVDHAKYAALIIHERNSTQSTPHKWESLLTFHRVIQSVSKDLLLVYVMAPDKPETIFDSPNCITNMKITTKIFNAQSNLTI